MSHSESELNKIFLKSCAQVETCGRPQMVVHKSCGLKPVIRKKPHRLIGRFSDSEREIVLKKVKAANMTVNEFIRAVALGSDYKPLPDAVLHKILIGLNKELTAQGRNVNQIAKHLNGGTATSGQAVDMLDAIRVPLVRALYAVKNALVQTAPHP